ncbi:MAG: alkaline phosphatase family protein [Mycobacterium sp.]
MAASPTACAEPSSASTSSSTNAAGKHPATNNTKHDAPAPKHQADPASATPPKTAVHSAKHSAPAALSTKPSPTAAVKMSQPSPVPVAAVASHAVARPAAAVVATAATTNSTTSHVLTPAASSSTSTIHTIVSTVVGAAKQFMKTLLGPLVSTLPSNVPAQSPVVWTVLAWVRKEIEQNLFPPQAAAPAWTVTSPNLLVNPSAELGDPSLTGTSSVTIPGWTVTGTPTVIEYGTQRRIAVPFGTPGPLMPSYANFPSDRPTAGDVQFFGGGNVGTATLSQTVDLSGAAANIDAGSLPFKLSGWLGGAMTDPSAASVTVRFLGADGTQLGTGNIGPVTSLDRFFQTGLLQRDTSGTIPVGTRSAQVVLTLKDSNPASLGYNNAYADDLSFTVGAALPAPAPPTPPVSTVGSLDHVFMVYMENKGYGDIVGSPNAPYINSLANTYGVETDYYALTHPSDPNYYPILGGSDFGINYNCAANCINAPNLADSIEAAGKTWAGYAQGMSAAGPYVATSDYAPDELPFLAYQDIYNNQARATAHILPLTQMANDLQSASTTPNFAWFAANEANNMEGPVDGVSGVLKYLGGLLTNHQYNVKAGDNFIQSTVSTIMDSPVWQDPTQKSAIFLTFDEDTDNLSLGFGNGGNHVVTIVIPSPGAVAGGMRSGHFTDDSYANHYSLARTIEDALGLPTLTDNDTYAQPMNGFWGSSTSVMP